MIIYVYNKNLERIGIVEDIASLQWLSQYQDAGEIKLICSASDKNRNLLSNGNRIYCTDQTESAIVTQTETTDDGKTAQLTVRAVLSVYRWSDRTVIATENITNIENGMLALVNKNRRGLSGLTAASSGIATTSDTQITWGSVLNGLIKLAKAYNLGFKETFNTENGMETFSVYQGTNRTIGENYNGYFGDDIGNVSSVSIIDSTADFKNFAYVGGEGEGTNRTVVSVSIGSFTGDNLKELWVDAKHISKTYQIATDVEGEYTQGTYTDSEYNAILQSYGTEKLAEALKTFSVTAQISQEIMKYNTDYFLGDIVPIKLTKYNLIFSARISAVKTVWEPKGKSVTAQLTDFEII